jgi:arabinofuranosyltransferase
VIRSRDNLERALTFALVTCFVCHAALFLGSIFDDAFISFRYARNLVEGHGLVFNLGERVEGFSNFSWVMLSAASLAIGVPPAVTTPLVGVLAGVLLVLLMVRAGRRLADHEGGLRGAGLIGAALVVITPGLALYAVSGLEQTAFALLSTLAALALVERRAVRFALYTSLAFLTRPEAGLLGVLGALFALLDLRSVPRREWLKTQLTIVGLFVLCLGPYLAFKLGYYGSLVPNTLRAKEPYLPAALEYTARGTWPALLIAGLVILTWRRGELSRERRELFVLWASFVAACILVGPDWMPAYRFLLPSVPLLGLAADGVLLRALATARSDSRQPALLAALALALFAVPSVLLTVEQLPFAIGHEHRNAMNRQMARELVEQGVRKLATVNVGMLGYAAPELTIIDLVGLCDAEIARLPGRHLHKGVPDAYLLSRDADAYLLVSEHPIERDPAHPGGYFYIPYMEIEGEVFTRPWFQERYAYARSQQLFPQLFHHVFTRRAGR